MLALACGSDVQTNTGTTTSDAIMSTGSTGSGGGTTGSTGTTSASTSSSGGQEPTCNAPEPPTAGKEKTIGTIKGTLHDLMGNPVPNVLADVCGVNSCLSGLTDELGAFEVSGSLQKLVDPALTTGDGRVVVKMAGQIPTLPGYDFGVINTVRLPDFAEGTPFPASGDVANGSVTLSIAPGASIKHNLILYTEESERTLRTVTFKPGDGAFPAITESQGFDLMIGIAPIDTTICPGVTLTFDNTEGWAPGAEIEVWFNEHNTFETWAPYGGWAKVAEGAVTEDGETVSTTTPEGIVALGLFGIKLK